MECRNFKFLNEMNVQNKRQFENNRFEIEPPKRAT